MRALRQPVVLISVQRKMMDLNVPDVPVLSTERFNLVELDEKHAPAVFRLRSSPDVNRYLGRQPAATIEDAVDFIGKIRKATAAKDALYWAVTQKRKTTSWEPRS